MPPRPATSRKGDDEAHSSRVEFVLDSILCLLYDTHESRFEFDLIFPEYGFGKLADLYEGIVNVVDDYGLADVAAPFEEEGDKLQALYEVLFHDNQLGLQTSVYRQFDEKQRRTIFDFGAMHWDELRLFILHMTVPSPKAPATRLSHLLELMHEFNKLLKDLTREYLLDSPAFYDKEVLSRTFTKENDDLRPRPDGEDGDSDNGGDTQYNLPDGAEKQLPKRAKTVWEELRLNQDAQIRLDNLQNKKSLFQNIPKAEKASSCPSCHATLHLYDPSRSGDNDGNDNEGDENEVKNEDEDQEADDDDETDFITFPGKLAGHEAKPIIDTGGGVNLVTKGWLLKNGIQYTRGQLPQTTLWVAGGDRTKKLDKIKLNWRYDIMPDKTWEDVEFVIAEDGVETLLGLPFLKKTKVIHSNAGRIIFPEFKKIPRPIGPDGSVPIYNTGTHRGKK
ncbi:hypothetical protein BDZ91DRAFT_735137 [Kalaharituber pfeilii]|nr:hypothetical protein BDZ91DRAFT_735137 [Kalaharituber pfeilii]